MELTPWMAAVGILFFAGASFFFSLAETGSSDKLPLITIPAQ